MLITGLPELDALSMATMSLSLLPTVALAAALCLASPALQARDINLGGHQEEPEKKEKPRHIVTLPTIELSLAREDGGWNHIRVDAWLTTRDDDTTEELDKMRSTIVRLTQDALPERDFQDYKAPRQGFRLVKQIIRQAADKSLGHPWKGEVMIKNMLAY